MSNENLARIHTGTVGHSFAYVGVVTVGGARVHETEATGSETTALQLAAEWAESHGYTVLREWDVTIGEPSHHRSQRHTVSAPDAESALVAVRARVARGPRRVPVEAYCGEMDRGMRTEWQVAS